MHQQPDGSQGGGSYEGNHMQKSAASVRGNKHFILPRPSAADTVFRPQLSIYCVVLVWMNVILWHKHICDDRASHCWLLYTWKKSGLSWDDDLQKFSKDTVRVFFQSASSCDFTLESVLLLKALQCLGTWASQLQNNGKMHMRDKKGAAAFPRSCLTGPTCLNLSPQEAEPELPWLNRAKSRQHF